MEKREHLIKIGSKTRFKKGHVGYKGMLGGKHSEQTRKKMSEAKKRNPVRYWLGKKRSDMAGEKHPLWKGFHLDKDGYKLLYLPDHPLANKNGYVREHRANVIEAIPNEFIVHHKDGNKRNNDPDNLEVLSRSEHMRLHNQERKRNALGQFI
jgi:hypothetical protein